MAQPGLKQWRAEIETELVRTGRRKYFSPVVYGQYKITLPLIQETANGRFIDLGCGDMPYREFVEGQVERYDTFDVEERTAGVTYIGDIQDMSEVPSNLYDSAACLEVLEHVPDPFRAAREIFRVLKPGGIVVISVPHLSRLHEIPWDFFRYTRYGVTAVLEQSGLEVLSVSRRGGLFSFLGHQASIILLSSTSRIPVVRRLAWTVNKWLITKGAFALDGVIDRGGLFALGYSAVARKPVANGAPEKRQAKRRTPTKANADATPALPVKAAATQGTDVDD